MELRQTFFYMILRLLLGIVGLHDLLRPRLSRRGVGRHQGCSRELFVVPVCTEQTNGIAKEFVSVAKASS